MPVTGGGQKNLARKAGKTIGRNGGRHTKRKGRY